MKKYFEIRYKYDAGRQKVWKAICEYIQKDIPILSTVLDLGAGYCDFINQIVASKKYALDVNRDVQDYCLPEVHFLHSNVSEIGIPDQSADVVFASNLLEHLKEDVLSSLFAELRRILRSGGLLILVQPNYYYCYRRYWDDFTHVKAYTHESLPDMLLSMNYRIKRIEKRFVPFSFQACPIRSYLLTRFYLALPWRPFAAQMLIVAQKGEEE